MSQHIHKFNTEAEYNEHKAGGCKPCVALVEETQNNLGLVESFTYDNLGFLSELTFYYACTNFPHLEVGTYYSSAQTTTVFSTTKDKTTIVQSAAITAATNEVWQISAGTDSSHFVVYNWLCESDNGHIWVNPEFIEAIINGNGSVWNKFPLMVRTEKRNPEFGDIAYLITDPDEEELQAVAFSFGGRGLSNRIPTTPQNFSSQWQFGEYVFVMSGRGEYIDTECSADSVFSKNKKFATEAGGRVFYNNPSRKNKYYDAPLTIEATSPGYIYVDSRQIGYNPAYDEPGLLRYRVNGTTWQSIYTGQLHNGSTFWPIFLEAGSKVEFEGDTLKYGTLHTYRNDNFYHDFEWSDVISKPLFKANEGDIRFNVYGNIMSLAKNLEWEYPDSGFNDDGFYFGGIFAGNPGIDDASNLILPASHLFFDSYAAMFCSSSLSKAPKLPAVALAPNCYKYMFAGCQNLKKAPELPAKVMAPGCYTGMFQGCINLEEAPELPATALAECCYGAYYQGMFGGCSALKTIPELPATNLYPSCYYSMFRDCINIETVSDLPARVLVPACYYEMFFGCKSLYYIRCNARYGIDQDNSTYQWVGDIRTSTGGQIWVYRFANWPATINGVGPFIVNLFTD